MLTLRVPLIFPGLVSIKRINTVATAAVDPPGAPSSGYDRDLREPHPYKSGTDILDTRRYHDAVDIPAQIKVKRYEDIVMELGGDAPDSNLIVILHHMHLVPLGLISGGRCLIEKGSIITSYKSKAGAISIDPRFPLYVFEVRPGSPGFGPLGYDLEILYTATRQPRLRGG